MRFPRGSAGAASFWLLSLLLLILSPGFTLGATKYKETVLQTLDGQLPCGGMALDSSGNLYGTMCYGGANNGGVVYEFVRSDNGGGWSYRTLYSFCAKPNCSDGSWPSNSRLVIDTEGNLYGTTSGFSVDGLKYPGSVFKLVHNADRTSWKLKILHVFCAPARSGCKDGEAPQGKLAYVGAERGETYDGVSPLYGTTFYGGAHGQGAVFALSPSESGKRWDESIVYDFGTLDDYSDGANPLGVIADSDGNLFGTTSGGGLAPNRGVAFEISGNAKASGRAEKVLYAFTEGPSSGLTLDPDGNLYGVTANGGSGYCRDSHGCGLVYKLARNEAGYSFKPLHSFCQAKRCKDGYYPGGDLALDARGHLFGTSSYSISGRNYGGAVFELSGTQAKSLYQFCRDGECSDGFFPESGVIVNAEGDLFGTDFVGAFELQK